MSDWILVIGFGSIGRRHFNNLRQLGCPDVRLLRTTSGRAGAFPNPPDAKVYSRMQDALADGPSVVVVANPTSMHVDAATQAMAAGAHLLLEKPVSADAESADRLLGDASSRAVVCSMAYCFRYHPLYSGLRDAVQAGRIGRPFHAHAHQASFLPRWHPWEDYRTGYAARADLGGGVVRTLDHDLDMLRWTLGRPTQVLASAASLSGIGVTVEDTADMIFRFPDRLQAHVHVCFGRQDYSRAFWVVGEQGTLKLDWSAGTLVFADGKEAQTLVQLPGDFDLNTIYLEMARDALAGMGEQPPRAAVPLADGVAAVRMALAALESSRRGTLVELESD